MGYNDTDRERIKDFWKNIEKHQRDTVKLPQEKHTVKLSWLNPDARKMYRQNRDKYQYTYPMKMEGLCWDGNMVIAEVKLETVFIPDSCEIDTRVTMIDKFTIVELTYNGKHYHGLSSKADCDQSDVFTGMYNAYNRAFKSMIGVK